MAAKVEPTQLLFGYLRNGEPNQISVRISEPVSSGQAVRLGQLISEYLESDMKSEMIFAHRVERVEHAIL